MHCINCMTLSTSIDTSTGTGRAKVVNFWRLSSKATVYHTVPLQDSTIERKSISYLWL